MGKTKTSPLTVILVVGVLALMTFGIYYFVTSQTELGGNQHLNSLQVTGDCQTEPYIDPSVIDGVNKGTSVTSLTYYVIRNGQYIGTQTLGSSGKNFAIGDKVDIIVSKANYLDVKKSIEITRCGANDLPVEMYATDTSTIKIFNDNGNVVTDNVAGGTTNQSASSTPINMEVKFTANADESSGDMVYVVEATNTTQVDDLILSGATSVSVPDFYTVAGSGSIAKAYEVPALIDGNSQTYNLIIQPESGQTIDGTGVYTTAYTKQWFADTDGTFVYGVENADGTTEYEDNFDYDFIIA